MSDLSNGYEARSAEFMAGRSQSRVGVATVRAWAQSLPPGGTVLDLGCGHGVPISQVLIEEGFAVFGVDASASMTAAFAERFPQMHVACEAVEHSSFFGRTFDAVVAWGLMFLLPVESQIALIRKVAGALTRGGRFLFTAPTQAGTWEDLLTSTTSVSLGEDAYKGTLAAAGLTLAAEHEDEEDNHYYDTARR